MFKDKLQPTHTSTDKIRKQLTDFVERTNDKLHGKVEEKDAPKIDKSTEKLFKGKIKSDIKPKGPLDDNTS